MRRIPIRESCRHCRETFFPGDSYYAVPGFGCFCPDCMEALAASWRVTEGENGDRL